jgi:uncharacterized protein YggE
LKRLVGLILIATAALVIASTLGVAAAEAPTSATPPPHVLSVGGAGRAPIAADAEQTAADAAYHQALTAAVEDGKGKAQLLAQDAGATLGEVEDVIEGGGGVNCISPEAEYGYAPYEGAEPDFGSGAESVVSGASLPEAASSVSSSPRPVTKKKKKKKKKHPPAKAASAATCTVTAHVTLVYSLA